MIRLTGLGWRRGRVVATLAVVLPLLAMPSASADGSHRDSLGRYLADDSAPVSRQATGSSSRVPAPGVSAVLTTVDADSFAGAENAIYAADRKTIFIAYKRFKHDPFDPGGDDVPAELRVAKSADGGKTWAVTVVDPWAAEEGDLLQQSVSIDGDHGDTVYVAYLVQPLRGGTRLRVAKSTDGGQTWAIRRLASSTGEFKDMKVVDANTVLIASGAAGSSELQMFATSDGGDHWTHSPVHVGGLWYVGMDRGNAGRIWISAYNPGTTDLHAGTATSPSGPWTSKRVAGSASTSPESFTGLWSTLDMLRGKIYISFEDFQPSRGRSVIRVIRSTDGGKTWSRFSVDQGFGVAGKISLHAWTGQATDATDLFLSYWFYRASAHQGRARVAHSADGGATWTVGTLPEPDSVFPYIDTAVVNRDLQYVSYQVRHLATDDQFLRVARVDLTA